MKIGGYSHERADGKKKIGKKKTKNSKVSRFVSRNFGTILKLALLIAIVAAIGVVYACLTCLKVKTSGSESIEQ